MSERALWWFVGGFLIGSASTICALLEMGHLDVGKKDGEGVNGNKAKQTT